MMTRLGLFFKETLPQKETMKEKSCAGYFCDTLCISCFSGLICLAIWKGICWIFSLSMGEVYENLWMLYGTALTVIIVLIFQRKNDERSLLSFGLNKKTFMKHYWLGHGIGFMMLSMVLFLTYLFHGASFIGYVFHDPLLLILFFIGFMIQGFEEELLCRGMMMYGLAHEKSTVFAVMFNSFFFAWLHLGNDGMSILAFLNLVLCGIMLSLMAVYFDDLWVASGLHSMWNFAQGNIYGILVSGIDMGPSLFCFDLHGAFYLSGGRFGLEGNIATTIVLFITIVILCVYYRLKNSKEM